MSGLLPPRTGSLVTSASPKMSIGSPLRANVVLQAGVDPALAELYRPMLARETNRHQGIREGIAGETAELLTAAAEREGARLRLLTRDSDLSYAAEIFGAADRIRYLTPHLHEEMFSELRRPGDADPDTGLDIRTLELDASDEAMLEILRRPDVMAHLSEWDAGDALGDDMRGRIRASSALAVDHRCRGKSAGLRQRWVSHRSGVDSGPARRSQRSAVVSGFSSCAQQGRAHRVVAALRQPIGMPARRFHAADGNRSGDRGDRAGAPVQHRPTAVGAESTQHQPSPSAAQRNWLICARVPLMPSERCGGESPAQQRRLATGLTAQPTLPSAARGSGSAARTEAPMSLQIGKRR